MGLQLLDTDLIRTFVSVCETGSFRRAAERINRTPSAVSMQMAKLEEHLGAPLFQREGRSIAVSMKGEELFAYAKRILSLNEEAVSRFRKPNLSGLVRLGVPDDYETRLLPSVFARFAKVCPDAQIELVLATSPELVERVAKDELDVAIGTSEAMSTAEVPGELLHAEPMVWLGRVGGTAKLKRPLPVAVPGHHCAWRHMGLQALERADVAYRTAFTSEHSHGQLAALMADLAISPLPASYRTAELERIGEEAGLPEIGLVATHICVHPTANDTARAFADIARETFANHEVPSR
ncbi:LysR substrate-binding domain-containing protein [Acuticoccus sediminis]|nr:LysR substrate-binding domain-containing protein [Acuticoccus sediminis]